MIQNSLALNGFNVNREKNVKWKQKKKSSKIDKIDSCLFTVYSPFPDRETKVLFCDGRMIPRL